MRTITAAVVTWDDLKTYFKGSVFKRLDVRDDRMSGSSVNFSFDIEPKEVLFEYKVQAVDDPSDSEDGVSADPMKDIAKFLGHDIAGGEFFEKRAFSPDATSAALRAAASELEASRSRSHALLALRRASVMPILASALRAVRTHALRLAMSSKEEFEKLKDRIESKGWDVKQGEDSVGNPTLKIDIGDVYTAEIAVDSILYDYTFQFTDRPDLTKSGTTKDPIEEFRVYYTSEEVKEARSEARQKPRPDESPLSFQETVPAGQEPEDRQTVPTGPKREDRETMRA